MSKKHKKENEGGLIYSTNKNLSFDTNDEEKHENVSPSEQDLRIHLDRMGGGKLLTRIVGFAGNEEEITKLGKELKQKCGVGGTVKNDEILIQGDHRDKVLDILIKKGFRAKKAGG
jgi:translation initiation factor 1